MDLRKYKYINNTKSLPGYADAKAPATTSGGNSFNYGSAITSGLSALGGVVMLLIRQNILLTIC